MIALPTALAATAAAAAAAVMRWPVEYVPPLVPPEPPPWLEDSGLGVEPVFGVGVSGFAGSSEFEVSGLSRLPPGLLPPPGAFDSGGAFFGRGGLRIGMFGLPSRGKRGSRTPPFSG